MKSLFYADFSRRLGVSMDRKFIAEQLGVPPRNPGEMVSYWDEADLPLIVANLITHLGCIMLNIGQVQEVLGIKITGDFIVDHLGIEPEQREKRAMLFGEKQIPLIFMELSKHFKKMAATEVVTPPKAERKPAGKPKAEPAKQEAEIDPFTGEPVAADYDPFA